MMETWNGRRAGLEGARQRYGADAAYAEYLEDDLTVDLPDPDHSYASTEPFALLQPARWLNLGLSLGTQPAAPALASESTSDCSSCKQLTTKACACH